LERNNDDLDTLEKGTLNQRSFMGLPWIWDQVDDDNNRIKCQVTATDIVEAQKEEAIQVLLKDGEFDNIGDEEWAAIVATVAV
jgi:hypothetical protein